MNIQQLLELAINKNASDVHLQVGYPPMFRVAGALFVIPGTADISAQEIELLIAPLINSTQKSVFDSTFELDFSFQYYDKARFRVNLYRQKGFPAASLRLVPSEILPLEELGFSPAVLKITDLRQGLVLVTGPTGHGKSTTLASFIEKINQTRSAHIVTIEDPIEYVFSKGKSLISQREMFQDTKTWANALKASLREDPDVVLIGEMRDFETIASAITIAETGHLVFATLHTNSAAQSIDRIVDVFPENQQPQIKLQLSSTLEAILSLRLVPTISPGRVLASEILFNSSSVKSVIREGKTYLIDNIIQTSAELGMRTLENSLTSLVKNGKISPETALSFALRPELLSKLLR